MAEGLNTFSAPDNPLDFMDPSLRKLRELPSYEDADCVGQAVKKRWRRLRGAYNPRSSDVMVSAG